MGIKFDVKGVLDFNMVQVISIKEVRIALFLFASYFVNHPFQIRLLYFYLGYIIYS